jgi:hypothetical protein
VGPRVGLDRSRKSLPSPIFDPRTVQPVATDGGEGEDRSIRHVTSQRRLYDNCEHRSPRGTNPVLHNGEWIVRTCITGDRMKLHYGSVSIATRGDE